MKYLFLIFFSIFFLCSCQIESDKNQVLKKEKKELHILTFEEMDARFRHQSDTTFVYNFWATWCKPCVKELPYFEKLNKEYADKKVRVVLVSLDFREVTESKVKPFIKEKGLESEVVIMDGGPNPNDWIDKIDKMWSGAIPATMVINTAKNHRQFYEKEFSYPELEEIILPLVSK